MHCVSVQVPSDSPFSDSEIYLFTIGCILNVKGQEGRKERNIHLITLVLFMMLAVIPMGLLNLDDNIYIQISMTLLLFLFIKYFFVRLYFFSRKRKRLTKLQLQIFSWLL